MDSDDELVNKIIPKKSTKSTSNDLDVIISDYEMTGYEMTKKGLLELINDIFLTNYWCTRRNMINITSDYMINLDQLDEWNKFFGSVGFDKINHMGYDYFTEHNKLRNKNVSDCLYKFARPVYDILNIGNGKISLCGGAVPFILRDCVQDDYDLFFHSGSVDELDDIFNKCLNYLNDLKEIKNIHDYTNTVTYTRSQYMMNVNVRVHTGIINFYGDLQFIKRAYKTKEQILFGFDLAPCRFGYNPKDGVFATICGAISLSMKAFALDSSIRSASFGSRLDKYCYNKEYLVFLPQLENNLITNKPNFCIFDNIILYENNPGQFRLKSYDTNNDDYSSQGENLIFLMEGNLDKIKFTSNDINIISELPDDFIEKEMRDDTKLFDKPSSVNNITKKVAKNFLGDKYNEFALSYFIDDDVKADDIWEEKTIYYIGLAKQGANNIKYNSDKNYYKGWKYLNPGQKYFGQNNPVSTPPSKYYKPLEIGINMNRFQALMDCRKNIDYIFNLPKELFNLICEYVLKYEVDDAKQRIFKLLISSKPTILEEKDEDELELVLPSWNDPDAIVFS